MVRSKKLFSGLTSYVPIFECEMNDDFTACVAIVIQKTVGCSENKSEMVLFYFWFDLLFINDRGH